MLTCCYAIDAFPITAGLSDVERAGTEKRELMISRKPLRAESPILTGLFRRKLLSVADYSSYYSPPAGEPLPSGVNYSSYYSYNSPQTGTRSVAYYSTQTNLTSL